MYPRREPSSPRYVVVIRVCALLCPQYIMELTFTQAAKGVNKEITVNMDASCQRCDGKGHEPGTKVQHCHHCNGSGMVSPSWLPLNKRSPTSYLYSFMQSE